MPFDEAYGHVQEVHAHFLLSGAGMVHDAGHLTLQFVGQEQGLDFVFDVLWFAIFVRDRMRKIEIGLDTVQTRPIGDRSQLAAAGRGKIKLSTDFIAYLPVDL